MNFWMKFFFHVLPAALTWIGLVGSTCLFYIILTYELINQLGLLGYVLFILDLCLFALSVSGLCMASLMDPGIHPIATHDEKVIGGLTPPNKLVEINGVKVDSKWCITCKIYRPPRASHCSVCGRCIEQLDHHCPWVYNCIGRRNYRHFLTFLVVVSLHMFCVLGLSLTYAVFNRHNISSWRCVFSIAMVLLCFFGSLGPVRLIMIHAEFIYRGITTREYLNRIFVGTNPFKQEFCKNFKRVFCSSQFPLYQGNLSNL